jgi:hypothetical protein
MGAKMNDQFLYNARSQLRRTFVSELYERLTSRVPARTRIVQFLRNPEKVFVAALAAALVAGVAWQMLNTEARFVKDVSGIAVREMNYHIVSRPQWILDNEDALSRPGPPSPTRTVSDAIDMLPFAFHMPTWIPEGMNLNDQNGDDPSTWSWIFHVEWFSEDAEKSIGLLVGEARNVATDLDVAPGKWKEINIDGVRSVLVRGDFQFPFSDFDECVDFFDSGGTWRPAFWNDNLGIRLMWVHEGIYYELSSPAWTGWRSVYAEYAESAMVSERDLIRMAESMIP